MLEDNNAHEERKMRLVFLGFTHPATILRFDFFPRWSRPWTRSCDPRRSCQKKIEDGIVSTLDRPGPVWHGQGSWQRKKERKKGVIDSRLTWPSVISNANCTLANCSFSALQQTRTKYPTTLFSPLSYSSLPSFLSSGENKNRSKLKCISPFKKI